MKIFLIVILLLSHSAMAASNCESTIEEGQHTSTNKQQAISSALEEATDNCYPGVAERLTTHCKTLQKDEKVYFQCTQEVTCTLCADNLTRKYEALD